MNGTATTYSSATATGYSAHTSSTTAATRRWGLPGATSTSPRSVGKRFGKTRQRVTLRLRRTSGGTGMTTTTQGPRLTRSGSRCPTREKPPSESPTQRRKRAKELLLHGKVIQRCHVGGRRRIADCQPRGSSSTNRRRAGGLLRPPQAKARHLPPIAGACDCLSP